MEKTKLKHVAIICDGNRRWAKEKGKPAVFGHKYAFSHTFDSLVDKAREIGLPYLTFWIFSTENWNRAKNEVSALLKLFRKGFSQSKKYEKKNIRLKYIGDIGKFDEDIKEGLENLVRKTKNNTGLTVTFGINYGGRDEIVRAIKKIIDKGLEIDEINMDNFGEFLDTKNLPDPDFVIRTSGEQRLSGFMPWQSTYSELYFPETKFPDFDGEKLEEAISEFEKRQRRFGK